MMNRIEYSFGTSGEIHVGRVALVLDADGTFEMSYQWGAHSQKQRGTLVPGAFETLSSLLEASEFPSCESLIPQPPGTIFTQIGALHGGRWNRIEIVRPPSYRPFMNEMAVLVSQLRPDVLPPMSGDRRYVASSEIVDESN
jgi:hypothetical protein